MALLNTTSASLLVATRRGDGPGVGIAQSLSAYVFYIHKALIHLAVHFIRAAPPNPVMGLVLDQDLPGLVDQAGRIFSLLQPANRAAIGSTYFSSSASKRLFCCFW